MRRLPVTDEMARDWVKLVMTESDRPREIRLMRDDVVSVEAADYLQWASMELGGASMDMYEARKLLNLAAIELVELPS